MRSILPALSVVIAGFLSTESRSAEITALKPAALRPGDTIALLAPAGVVDKKKVAEAVLNIEKRGYRVRVFPAAYDQRGYLAGGDTQRARDLNMAFGDPEVRMILCLRGGYGSPRILPLVDFDRIKRNPKIFVGYSDITALLIAIRQQAGVVTFHGPMAMADFSGKWGLAPFSANHFWSLLEMPEDPRSVDAELYRNWGGTPPKKMKAPRTLFPGVAEGKLTGGNLSTVVALMGTPYEIDTKDAILMLEDVNEEPFRIDRMLCQLEMSGKLRECRGIVLGGFTKCVAQNKRPTLTVEQVLDDYFGGLGVPVLANFPAGHLPQQATLPIGSMVRLDATARTLSLLEVPVDTRVQ
jgi:muramoyltetrapeptide carboxypeptidase